MDENGPQSPPATEIEHYLRVKDDLVEAIQKEGRVLFELTNASGRRGLINQGATCYLNSILQMLFIVPEFRSRLMAWSYDPGVHGGADRCIPLQLQRLFSRLLLSKAPAVKTTALTQSFGWSQADAFVQHDAQELLHVLLDALERASPEHDPASIFRGTVANYLREVRPHGRENVDGSVAPPLAARAWEEQFLNLELDVVGVSGVQESLERSVTPEVLSGENQWAADDGRRVDAEKGTALRRVPPLLTLHLKRFVFDLQLMRRRKVADAFAVPPTIDVAPALASPAIEALLGTTGALDATPGPENTLYDLAAVLIHHGTAMGGHYFAYVKDADSGDWFEANDSRVTAIPAAAMDLALAHTRTRAEEEAAARAARDGAGDGAGGDGGGAAAAEVAPASGAPGASTAVLMGTDDEAAIEAGVVSADGRFGNAIAAGFNASLRSALGDLGEDDVASSPTDAESKGDAGTATAEGTGVAAGADGCAGGVRAPARKAPVLRRGALLAALSQNAYMLLYRRRGWQDEGVAPGAPAQLAAEVAEEDAAFSALRRAYALHRDMAEVTVCRRRSARPEDDVHAAFPAHCSTSLRTVLARAHAQLSPGVPVERCRLRAFAPGRREAGRSFEGREGESLQALGMRRGADFELETRAEGETFRPFDPDEMRVTVVQWDSAAGALATDAGHMHDVVVPGSREATVGALRAVAATAAGVAAARCRLIVLDRCGATVLGDDAAVLRRAYGVAPGCEVVLEEAAEGGAIAGDDAAAASAVAAWHNERQNRVTIKFNALPPAGADAVAGTGAAAARAVKAAAPAAIPDYDAHSVAADLREPLRVVKTRVAAVLGETVDRLVLRRRANGPQLKDLDVTLRAAGFTDGSVLHVSRGLPLTPGEFAVGIVRYSPSDRARPFRKLFRLAVGADETIASLRTRVADRIGVSPEACVRLRQRRGAAAGPILRPARTLRRSFARVEDGMEILAQTLPSPEHVGPSDVVVTLQRLRPAVPPLQRASLDEPSEAVLARACTAGELRQLLSERVAAGGELAAADREGAEGGEGGEAAEGGAGDATRAGEGTRGQAADGAAEEAAATAGGPAPARVHFAKVPPFGASAAPSLASVRKLRWRECSSVADDAPVAAAPLALRDGAHLVFRSAAEHAASVRALRKRAEEKGATSGGPAGKSGGASGRRRFAARSAFAGADGVSVLSTRRAPRERAVRIDVAVPSQPKAAPAPSTTSESTGADADDHTRV